MRCGSQHLPPSPLGRPRKKGGPRRLRVAPVDRVSGSGGDRAGSRRLRCNFSATRSRAEAPVSPGQRRRFSPGSSDTESHEGRHPEAGRHQAGCRRHPRRCRRRPPDRGPDRRTPSASGNPRARRSSDHPWVLSAERAKDIELRSTTLRSRVLKDRVGSVRSQAAARYDVSPAELVAAALVPHPTLPNRLVDEDTIAETLAEAVGQPYLKIDPLKLDN